MFDRFGEYLKSLLIFSQGSMDDDNPGRRKEAEKIVIGLIGKDRVRVWQYFQGWGPSGPD